MADVVIDFKLHIRRKDVYGPQIYSTVARQVCRGLANL